MIVAGKVVDRGIVSTEHGIVSMKTTEDIYSEGTGSIRVEVAGYGKDRENI